jgi:hypothetical protein
VVDGKLSSTVLKDDMLALELPAAGVRLWKVGR